jgi:hypothetical protein
MYPVDAVDLFGKKGRLFQDNALMACKMCKVQDVRFTCRHNPSITLGNHLLMACEGFQESAHWRDPEVVQKGASMAMKVIFGCSYAGFAFHVPCEQCKGAITTQLRQIEGWGAGTSTSKNSDNRRHALQRICPNRPRTADALVHCYSDSTERCSPSSVRRICASCVFM